MTSRPSKRGMFAVSKEQQDFETMQSKALSSVQFCYKAFFASAAMDMAQAQGKLLQISTTNLLSQEALALLTVCWKLSFGFGLWSVTSKVMQDKALKVRDPKIMLQVCQTMGRLWRQSAWVLMLTSIANVVTRWQDRWVKIASACVFVVGSIGVRVLSSRETNKIMETETSRSLKEKDKPLYTVRSAGLIAARNMALCIGAAAFQGASLAHLTLVSDSSVMEKLFNLSGVPTPFITAGLLWKLRQSFMETVVFVTDDKKSKANNSEELYLKLFEAQTSFYSKVASTLQFEIVSKLLVGLSSFVSYLRSHG